jgi:hypothetical protein
MPAFILKVRTDRDLYVQWSTVVDNVVRVGTRAEFLEHLAAAEPWASDVWSTDLLHCPEARLGRADDYGTSAMWPTAEEPFGGWEDDLMVEQRGILPRADLEAYVDALLLADLRDPEKAYELLVPFDDDEGDLALDADDDAGVFTRPG